MVSMTDGDRLQTPKKRRSGSETRQRDHQVKLSLLGREHARLEELRKEAGLKSIQEYILYKLELATVS